MTMSVSSGGILLDQPHALLHSQERNNSRQNPQSNTHIVTVTFFLAILTVRVTVSVRMSVAVAIAVVVVRLDGMRNQMQKRIAQQSSGGERQQGFQPRLHLFGVVQRDGKQDEERCGTDQKG